MRSRSIDYETVFQLSFKITLLKLLRSFLSLFVDWADNITQQNFIWYDPDNYGDPNNPLWPNHVDGWPKVNYFFLFFFTFSLVFDNYLTYFVIFPNKYFLFEVLLYFCNNTVWRAFLQISYIDDSSWLGAFLHSLSSGSDSGSCATDQDNDSIHDHITRVIICAKAT